MSQAIRQTSRKKPPKRFWNKRSCRAATGRKRFDEGSFLSGWQETDAIVRDATSGISTAAVFG